MGKRVLVSLWVVALIFLAAANTPAQDAAEPEPEPEPDPIAWAFQPGEFFTQQDYGYLESALACVNMTPADLDYEKKHRPDDILRLKVCDDSLDHPLNVPHTAEDAAREFSAKSSATAGCMHAGKLLDQPGERWQPEQLQEDAKQYRELTEKSDKVYRRMKAYKGDPADAAYKKLKDEADSLLDAEHKMEAEALFGDEPKSLLPDADDAFQVMGRGLSSNFIAVPGTLSRQGFRLSNNEKANLASQLAQFMADEIKLDLPGSKPPEDEDGYKVFEQGAKIELEPILVAASRVWGILDDRAAFYSPRVNADAEGWTGTSDHKIPGVTGGVIAAWQSKWGKVVIGGTGPNTYEGDDFIGIIDLGGDDTYKGRIACGIGLEGHAPVSFALDLAGNDRYEGGDFTQGFGFMGVGILMDLGAGDDYYKAGFCAQGCGLGGYGELYDDGGDDEYRADSGAQGAGCFGYGQLTDVAGNDSYRGARYVQAFAQVMGVGVLSDGAGNDHYYAGGKYLHLPLWNDHYQSLSQGFAIGNRNDRGIGTGGGVALLLDEGDGNDFYNADIYGQGSSYWYSLGMLVDRGGNDNYTLGQYGMGGGIHLSTGILVDLAGNDTYTDYYGVGLGGAHDWAVGWLIDRAGNDLYSGNGQGQGLNFAIGILLDCAGDDSHSTNNEGSVGKGVNNDISLLLDLGGTDCYGPKGVFDGRFNRRGDHELVYDVPDGWFLGIDESTLPTVQDPAPELTKVQHILISWDGAGVDTQKAKRTKAEAEALAKDVLKQVRTKGADWEALQETYNEDCAKGEGYDQTHAIYTVTADAGLVKAFKDLGLKLGVGQIDICESGYGYHIIKRIK